MKVADLEEIMEHGQYGGVTFCGPCRDCGTHTQVTVDEGKEGYVIAGGAAYRRDGEYAVKCQACFDKDPVLRRKTEVYSRIVGYYRPVGNWHTAKQAEFVARKPFNIKEES